MENFLTPLDKEYGADNVCKPEAPGAVERSFGELAEKSDKSEGQGGNY